MSGSSSAYDSSTGVEHFESSYGYTETVTPDYRYGGFTYTDSRHPGATYTDSNGNSYYNSTADNPDYD